MSQFAGLFETSIEKCRNDFSLILSDDLIKSLEFTEDSTHHSTMNDGVDERGQQ